MTSWAWVLATRTGGTWAETSEWVRARSRAVSLKLTGPSTAQWESDGDDPAALTAVELATDLIAYRDGTPVFRGRLGGSSDSGDETSHKISWSAVDYRGVLTDGRMIWPTSTHTYAGVDQALIVKDLVQDSQALTSGHMGIDLTALTSTGTPRDRTYETGKSVGEAIQQLSEVIGGFDWSVEPDMKLRVWHPQRGTARAWIADLGGTVTAWTRTVDSARYGTDLYGTGDDSLLPIVRSTALTRIGGRWERAVSWPDVSVSSTLVEHTEGALADAEQIRPTYQVTVRQGTWDPSDAWLGDTVQLVIQSGRVQVNEPVRIVQIDIKVGDDGDEQVTLSFGRPPQSLVDRLRADRQRLAVVERR